MIHLLDPLRELTVFSVCFRVVLSVLCGGVIGVERECKRRPAGFRTHILICLGAAMTTLTSQYLLVMNYYTDIARLGAQVIAGVGFIGAGTIIVTKRKHVKGLTTAAGLWVAAIVGLACGAGYYEAAAFATVLILLSELVFSKMEYRILKSAQDVTLYVEYTETAALERAFREIRNADASVGDLEIVRAPNGEQSRSSAVFTLHTRKSAGYEHLMDQIARSDGIYSVEEL